MMILACDLGGTRMKIGVVRDGEVLAKTSIDANSKAGLVPGLPALANAWRQLLDGLQLTIADCAGISVGFPSLVDVATGRVLVEYGKYADAMEFNLRDWAKSEFNLPLAIENDARLALIGEWKFGAGRGSDNVVMITLGTGIGTSAVIQGRVLRGLHSQAGVLGGHFTIRYGGRKCSCGNVGCSEAEASTAFLHDIARDDPNFSMSHLASELKLDFAAVFKHAANGDACAVKLRDHSLLVWSTLVVNLIHAYDPEIVVIGGGIMASAETILPAIRKYVRCHAHTPWGQVRIVAGELGDNAALIPGECLLLDQFPELNS